jgi:hypothetical protein
VLPVNDPPTLAPIGGLALAEDAGQRDDLRAGIGTGAFNETEPLTVRAISSNPALVPHPVVNYASPSASGVLLLTIVGDRSGLATITVTVDDGQPLNHSTSRTFDVVVHSVNDAPAFAAGPSLVILEDSGPQTFAAWASAISAGPPDEAAQALTFTTTTDNEALFSTQPAVTPDGTLTFETAPDANGEATVTVLLRDNGGTSGGGVDSSPAQTFTIRVTPVNDAPTFAILGDQSVIQDAGPQVLRKFAHPISPGAENESNQNVTFIVTTDKSALFAVSPQISKDGTLSFVPRPEASGTATVTVRLRDDGGTANGGVDTSAVKTFRIAVTTFQEETGTYNGLALPALGATPGAEKTGLLRLTVAKRGSFTGRLKFGGATFPLRGAFDKAGVPHFLPGATSTASIPRKGEVPLILSLNLDVSAGTDQLTGTLTEGDAPFAAITANRALYTRSRNPRAPMRLVEPDLLGKYTVLFAAKTPAEHALAAAQVPQGDGFGRLTVAASGVARLAGRLADGSNVSYANALSKENALPVWVPFARGKGSLAGPVTFREMPGISDVDGLDLQWFKPANPNSSAYPAGWPAGIHVDLVGAAYAVPPRGSGQSIFPGLPLADVDGNALAYLLDEATAPPFLTIPINLNPKNQVLVIAPGEDRFHAVLVPAFGWFRGSFVDPTSGHLTRFHGAILQKQQRGAGYFSRPDGSGSVTIEPKTP